MSRSPPAKPSPLASTCALLRSHASCGSRGADAAALARLGAVEREGKDAVRQCTDPFSDAMLAPALPNGQAAALWRPQTLPWRRRRDWKQSFVFLRWALMVTGLLLSGANFRH